MGLQCGISRYRGRMSGKPFQSVLRPYESEVYEYLGRNISYRGIAESLNKKYGLRISHNAVYSFVTAASRKNRLKKAFYDGLDSDLKKNLLKQITAVWTYDSNSIEGNTLTLGETMQVLEFGLTISGKPLKDHQEVYGHARAIDMIRNIISAGDLTVDYIFELHRAIMPQSPADALNPIGAWKRDYNGTTGILDGQRKYIEYVAPPSVPVFMAQWLKDFNRIPDASGSMSMAMDAYTWVHMTFVRIHPFFDGNGRMARLLANIPVLRGGFPPILVSPEQRGRYIELLWSYQLSVGELKRGGVLMPEHKAVDDFKKLLTGEWQKVMELVAEVRAIQAKRNANQVG